MIQRLIVLRQICKCSLQLFIIVIFCSCEYTTSKDQSAPKTTDSMATNKKSKLINEAANLTDKGVIALIEERKELPIEIMMNHFYFDSTFLSTQDYVSGFSIKRYDDSVYLVCIDFYKSPCGDQYLITLGSSTLKEIDKILIATYCDSDQILNDQTTRCKFKSDSTFETEEILYGKGQLSSNGQKANLVYKKNWMITKNGKITLISSQESEQ